MTLLTISADVAIPLHVTDSPASFLYIESSKVSSNSSLNFSSPLFPFV
ncbi:unnamed protein product [Brassica oleracea]